MKKLIFIILLFVVASCDVFITDPSVKSSEIKVITSKVDTTHALYEVNLDGQKYFVNREGDIIYRHTETWAFLIVFAVFVLFVFMIGHSVGDN